MLFDRRGVCWIPLFTSGSTQKANLRGPGLNNRVITGNPARLCNRSLKSINSITRLFSLRHWEHSIISSSMEPTLIINKQNKNQKTNQESPKLLTHLSFSSEKSVRVRTGAQARLSKVNQTSYRYVQPPETASNTYETSLTWNKDKRYIHVGSRSSCTKQNSANIRIHDSPLGSMHAHVSAGVYNLL